MNRYRVDIDLSRRNTSHTLVVEMVGSGRRVLDVGCSTGHLAAVLGEQGNVVDGVELDAEAAERARPHLERLVVGNLETLPLPEAFPGQKYDRIVTADVLEHLTDPVSVLRGARELLADDGELIASIPNVAHGSVRLALLLGQWEYTPVGLLDATHLQFFTLDTLVDLLADAGFGVVEVYATLADPLATNVAVAGEALPDGIVEWVREQPTSLHYQYVLRATAQDEPSRTPPEVKLPVPADSVRHSDDLSARHHERTAHEQAPTLHDRVIGLEARVARVEQEAKAMLLENEGLRRDLAATAAHRAAVYRSETWRIGQFALAPVRAARAVRRRAARARAR